MVGGEFCVVCSVQALIYHRGKEDIHIVDYLI